MSIKDSSSSYSTYEWGVVWMMLSATCLSLSFLFLKINLSYVNYYFLLFLRFAIPLLFVSIAVLYLRDWKSLKSSISLQLSRALCVVVAQYGIAYYISKNTLLNATVLLNASPLFIPLIEWVFLKHRPGKSTIVGALLAFFGVLLVLRPNISLFTPMSAVGLIAALAQASSQVLFGLKPKAQSPIGGLFYLFFFTTLIALVVFLLAEDIEKGNKFGLIEGTIILSIVAMAVATLFNQFFRGLAYLCGRPSTLATFLYFSVFVSVLFDWLVFKNIPTPLSIIGSLLVLMGGVLKIFLRAKILKKKQKK